MKTPNSRNSTALSAEVYENFCPRGPASNTPSPPLWTDMVFSGTPLRCPHGLWMPPMEFSNYLNVTLLNLHCPAIQMTSILEISCKSPKLQN